jgi:glycogen debranching enzyme
MEARLWDESAGLYVDFDVEAGRHVTVRTAAGLAPLLAGVPTADRAGRMIEDLAGSRVEVDGGTGWVVTSLAPDDPGFIPTRYWRGPIWPILNWTLQRGLDRYGHHDLARQVRRGLIGLASRGGFWEHYSPLTGKGHGGERFAWTAGIVLDMLATEAQSEEEDRQMDGDVVRVVDATDTSTSERRE